jgi:arylsulfatase A-like enzyme
MNQRPDVILIMTDQHRHDHVGFGGNTIVQTPHLDELAARSVVFDRAYVTNPICMPSRSSIMTGLMPSVHGTRFNGVALDPGHHTFVRSLRTAGYRTVLVGKSHLQNMGNRADLIPRLVDQSPEPDAYIPNREPGWATWEVSSRYDDETAQHVVPPDFYGFDHVEFTVEHSDVAGGHYRRWLRAKGLDPSSFQGRQFALEASDLWNQIWKPACGEDLYPTTFIAERSIAAIVETPSDQPLMLQCSFPDPHHPFTPPGRFYDMYSPSGVEIPSTFTDGHDRSMPHIKRMISDRGKQFFPVAAWAPTEGQLRAALAAEYGSITMIDEAIGRVIAALEAAGRTNAIVVFTSDHGDMFGDHGLMLKAALHYQACIRVPFTISAPSVKPRRTAALTSHLDLGATLLDLVGLPTWVGQQGRSLGAVLTGDDSAGRESVLIEEDQMFDLAGAGQPLRMRTIVSDEFRYTRYAGLPHGELFDLTEDPNETHNLFDPTSPSKLQRDAQEELLSVLIDAGERTRRATHLA